MADPVHILITGGAGQVGLELQEMAAAYATKTAGLSSDPCFREALVKVAVSDVTWALFDAFGDDASSLDTLGSEIAEQAAAIGRACLDKK